jgi:IS30 family transposase
MSFHHLTIEEREVISQMNYSDASLSQIAKSLGRDRSTISRELSRNSLPDRGDYHAHQAQWFADVRRSASKEKFQQHTRAVWSYVKQRLKEGWSPEQIMGRMEADHPNDESMRISHATIYAWIAEEKRTGGEMWKYLRQSGRKRRKRYGSQSNCGRIKDRVGIEHRPAVVSQRSRLGDWESDTVEGQGKRGYLVTHVERKSRYVVAARIDDKRAASFNCGTRRAFRWIPLSLRKTLTADNGKEFANFQEIEKLLGIDVYFADPYSSWQRGTNENTNGLLREYFPKGMDLRSVSHQRVAAVVRKLNNRPRKCLGYRTPREVLFEDNR